MGGIPLIYNGQEVGCPVKLPFFSKSPINWTTNPDMMQEYKKLMAIRVSNQAVRTGTLENFSTADITAFRRKAGSNEILVLANVRNSTKTYTIPATFQNTTWKNAMTNGNVSLGTNLELKNFEYLILIK